MAKYRSFRRAAISTLAAAAVTMMFGVFPSAANADTVTVGGVTATTGLPSIDTSNPVACPLNEHYLYAQGVTGKTSNSTTSPGEIDITWHADPYAAVNSPTMSCLAGVKVDATLTDETEVPGCQPAYTSPTVSAESDDVLNWTFQPPDYEVSDPISFTVPYFNVAPAIPGTNPLPPIVIQSDSGPSALSECQRVHSSVTISAKAYYKNSLKQYILFCTGSATYEFLATPAGPEQVGDPLIATTC